MQTSTTSSPPRPPNATDPPNPSQRILGYDVARSLALLGMILVHFSLVAAGDSPSFLDGRPSATFIILAGIGISLMTRRVTATGDAAAIRQMRKVLARRGVFLLVLGFVNLAVFPGDILRVYGVSMLVISMLFTASSRALLVSALTVMAASFVLVIAGDFESNWDWDTLTYRDLWTPVGAVRNLFYNGFRSVLPWTGLVFLGLVIGRLDLTQRRRRRTLFAISLATAVVSEWTSSALVAYLHRNPIAELDSDTTIALFGTTSMPAFPLFLLATLGTATAVITLSVELTSRWPTQLWQPFVAMGQMSLTWYLAHILIGLGVLLELGMEGTETQGMALAYGGLFYGAALCLSWAWRRKCHRGPAEWVMRRVAG